MKHRPASSAALRMAIALAVAVATWPAAIHAQDVAYAAGTFDLDSATQAVLANDIARARDRGLPVDPLIAKVREGRLKRASGARIRVAVERLSERLGSSREALGSASSMEEVIAGADALAAGAQPASLRAVRAATRQVVTAPIGVLAQLLASGVSEAKAVEMVLTLLHRNASPATLIALGNQVEYDVATGLSAAASAAFRMRALDSNPSGDAATAAATSGGLNAGPPSSNGAGGTPRRKP